MRLPTDRVKSPAVARMEISVDRLAQTVQQMFTVNEEYITQEIQNILNEKTVEAQLKELIKNEVSAAFDRRIKSHINREVDAAMASLIPLENLRRYAQKKILEAIEALREPPIKAGGTTDG